MDKDRDSSPGSEPTGPPTQPPEYTLWTMAQEPRRLEARVRLGGLGLELRLLIDDELIWSQAFGSSAALTREAEQKRLDFQGRGWATKSPTRHTNRTRSTPFTSRWLNGPDSASPSCSTSHTAR